MQQHLSVTPQQHGFGHTAAHQNTEAQELTTVGCKEKGKETPFYDNPAGLRGRRAKQGLLDIATLDAVNEELLPLVGCIAGALVKGVSEEEHGIQHHPTGPHIYWPALVCLLLPHIGQHFGSCIANHSPALCCHCTLGCHKSVCVLCAVGYMYLGYRQTPPTLSRLFRRLLFHTVGQQCELLLHACCLV